MRRYKGNKLTSVICNCCGRKLIVENEIVKEGVTRMYARWDYFSEKDGETHGFDMCEQCYDKMVEGFVYSVSIVNETELL